MRKVLVALAVIVVVLAVAVVAVLLIMDRNTKADDSERYQSTDEKTGEFYYDGAWYKERSDVESFLLLGVDKFEDTEESYGFTNNEQADFLLVVVVDHDTGECSALQLNRDTMTDITMLGYGDANAGTTTEQLALAHTYGSGGADSCINTVNAVSNLLYGTTIDHYAAVTMDAVSVINDMVGGVTLTVTENLTSYDPALKKGAEVTLTGEQALTYVRARYNVGDSSNLNRMERQREYILDLWAKVNEESETDSNFLTKVFVEISSYLTTNCSDRLLSELFETVGDFDLSEIQTTTGEAVQGETYIEYYVDEDALRKQVIELFYEEVAQD